LIQLSADQKVPEFFKEAPLGIVTCEEVGNREILREENSSYDQENY
jgi:hypothetical protein